MDFIRDVFIGISPGALAGMAAIGMFVVVMIIPAKGKGQTIWDWWEQHLPKKPDEKADPDAKEVEGSGGLDPKHYGVK